MDNRTRRQRGRHHDTTTQYDGSPTRRNEDFMGHPSMTVPSSPAAHRSFRVSSPYDPPATPSSYTVPLTPETYGMPDEVSSYYHHHPSDSLYHNPGSSYAFDAGGSSDNHMDPINTFWTSPEQYHDPNDVRGSNPYKFDAQHESERGRSGNVVSQQGDVCEFEGRETPTQDEIQARQKRFKQFKWQRSLKTEDLREVYLKISNKWHPMARTTFFKSLRLLNEHLHQNPSSIQLILNNNAKIIERIAAGLNPKERAAANVRQPDNSVMMADFLTSELPKYPAERPHIPEGMAPIQVHENHSWAPIGMAEDYQSELLAKLMIIWRMSKARTNARLLNYDPEDIAKYAPYIMDDDFDTAIDGANRLTSSFTETHQLRVRRGRRQGRAKLMQVAQRSAPPEHSQQYAPAQYGQQDSFGQNNQEDLFSLYRQQQMLGQYAQHDPAPQYTYQGLQGNIGQPSNLGQSSHQVSHDLFLQSGQMSEAELAMLQYDQMLRVHKRRGQARRQALQDDINSDSEKRR